MAGGVRLGTGYVEITAETSQIPKQLKEALDQAGTVSKTAGKDLGKKLGEGLWGGLGGTGSASKSAAAVGEKIGKDLSTGLNKGMDPKKAGKKIGTDLVAGLSGGGKVIGEKIGKEIATGIATGTEPKKTGKKVTDDIHAGSGAKEAGKKIGKDISTGVTEGMKDVGDKFRKGDLKGGMDTLAKDVKNVTSSIDDVTSKVGIHLDGLKNWGATTATTLSNAGTAAQHISDNLKNVTADLGGLTKGDIPTRLGGLSKLLTDLDPLTKPIGINLKPAADGLQQFANAANTVHGIKDDLASVGTSLAAIPGLSTGATNALAGLKGGKIGSMFAEGGLLSGGILGAEGMGAMGTTLAMGLTPIFAGLGLIIVGAIKGLKDKQHRPGEIDEGPTPPTPAAMAAAGKAIPPTPGPAPDGTSWQLIDGQWKAVPMVGGPAIATGPHGAPKPPAPAPGGEDLDALNKARAAQGLPPVNAEGQPIYGPYRVQPLNPPGAPTTPPPPPARTTMPTVFPPTAIPGMAEITRGATTATIQAQTGIMNTGSATVNAGTVNVAGGGSSAGLPARGSKTSWYDIGGAITGSGAIPITAHGGEWMIQKPAVDKYGTGFMAAVNNMTFDNGGYIPDPKNVASGSGKDPNAATMAGIAAGQAWARAHPGEDLFGQFAPPLTAPEPGPNLFYDEGGKTPPPMPHPGMKWDGTNWVDPPPKPAQLFGPKGQAGEPTDQPPAPAATDRTAGFIPAGAGSTSVSGTSFLASILNMGNQAIGGLIDAGAQAAEMGVTAAAAAGSLGAGAAAGPTASVGIQMGAAELKRLSSFGFQLASIGADALIEQLTPFGTPRWLGYDYTQFVPNVDVGQLATTTVEKAMQAKQGGGQGPEQQPGGPVAPPQMGGAQPPGKPVPTFGSPAAASPPIPGPPGTAPLGQQQQQGAAAMTPKIGGPTPAPGAPPPPPPPPPSQTPQDMGASALLPKVFGMDEGGWLPTNTAALNSSGRPELVLSPQQLNAQLSNPDFKRAFGVYIENMTAVDADDVSRKIASRQNLAVMQYSGRPGPA
jgi:hypothetical protein